MCGRIACALGVEDLSCATACKSKDGKVYTKSNTHKSTIDFQPSFNVPPTSLVPVLVSADNFLKTNNTGSDRMLVKMRFGVIPHWLHLKPEQEKSYNNETHLSKKENLRNSKLYGPLYERGFRCAIPCIGYYEWQSTKGPTRQPYFFYNKNNSSEALKNIEGTFDTDKGWTGVELLYLAGIYNSYTNPNNDETYTFAIITKETNEEWKYVHHRMPVVLQNEEQVNDWIKPHEKNTSEPFEILDTEISNLATYPVEKTVVNKTRNNTAACIAPIIENKHNKLTLWLKTETATESATPVTESTSSSKKILSPLNKTLTPSTKKPAGKRASLDSWLQSAQKKQKN